jgi:hypothetical protein
MGNKQSSETQNEENKAYKDGDSSSSESGSGSSESSSGSSESSTSKDNDNTSSESSSDDSSSSEKKDEKKGGIFGNFFKGKEDKESSSSSSDDGDTVVKKAKGLFNEKSSDSSSSSEKEQGKKKGLWDYMTGNTSSSSSSESSSSSSSSESKDDSTKKSSKNLMKSVFSVLQGNTYLEKFIFIILVVIAFVILLSIGSNILSAILEPNDPYLIDGLYTASNSKVISQDPMKKDSVVIRRSENETYGIEFSWSVWMNVSSLDDNPANSGQYKHVFSKGDNVSVDSRGMNAPNNSPGLYIDKRTNSIVVIMNTFEQIEEMITVAGIPLNKWIHILIRVEGAFLDVYVNGTLAKRKVLSSVPKQNNGNVYVCHNGGFSGFISNLRYFKKALEPGDILSIVNKGPSLKLSKLEKQDLKRNNSNYLAMDWYFQN